MNYDQKKGQESKFDHKPLESKGQMNSNWGMLYIVGKIFLRAMKYCPQVSKNNWFEKDINIQSFGTTKVPFLGPTWKS